MLDGSVSCVWRPDQALGQMAGQLIVHHPTANTNQSGLLMAPKPICVVYHAFSLVVIDPNWIVRSCCQDNEDPAFPIFR
jgi:hypothetical protein